MNRTHFGPVYMKRRHSRWMVNLDIHLIRKGRKDSVPLYRFDVDISNHAADVLRARKYRKYHFPRWELHSGGFYKQWVSS